MFKPMLAATPKTVDGRPVLPDFPLIVQPKLDGIRAAIRGGRLLTRTLKEVPNTEIFCQLSSLRLEGLDGELIVGNPTATDCYRRTQRYCMTKDATGEPWKLFVFDYWNSTESFTERWKQALARSEGDPNITIVPTFEVHTWGGIEAYERECVVAGFEGVIIRNPRTPYKHGRAGAKGELVKLKRFIDFEAEVIGVYEELHNANEAKADAFGRTKRSSHKANKLSKGTLGGLVLRAINGPCEGQEFRCGSGFSASDRAELWRSPPTGRTAKIKSFPVGVKDKPRHPVFLAWRDSMDS